MEEPEYSPAVDRIVSNIEKRLDGDENIYRTRPRVRPDDNPSDPAVQRMLVDLHKRKFDRFLCRLLGSPDGGFFIYTNVYFAPLYSYVPEERRPTGLSPLYVMTGVSGPQTHQAHPIETPLVRHFPTMKLVRDPDGKERWDLAHPVLDADGRPILNASGRIHFRATERPEAIELALWAPIPFGKREKSGDPWHGFALYLHDHALTQGEFDDLAEWSDREDVLLALCGPTADDPRPRGVSVASLQAVLAANGWAPDLNDPPEPEPNPRDLPMRATEEE